MSGRPVPWASWDEWLGLRDDLWSTDPQRQEAGLQQVCAWRLRGKLPLGVDATAHLLDARRADAEWQRAVAWAAEAAVAAPPMSMCGSLTDAAVAAGELPLRLRYSLPLIRLVNGISDSQQRGRVASSVAVLSDAAGLPRALVDVRHDATHNELPSLPLLRAAADSALAWLWDNYWDGQSRALSSAAERISSLLSCLANSWRAATAAGLSCGAGGLAAAADEAGDEGDMDGEAAGAYSGSEGQRARRQAMSELRSLVPSGFTHELLQPILDCPALRPPDVTPAPAAPAPQQPQQQQREAVEAKAWRSTMRQLLKWYPRLRPLLLQAALRRLAAAVGHAPETSTALPAQHSDATGDALTKPDGEAHACALWAMRLLPASAMTLPAPSAGQAAPRLGSPPRKPSSKRAATTPARANPRSGEDAGNAAGFSGGDPLLDAPLTSQQLQELLVVATAAGTMGPPSSDQGRQGAKDLSGAAASQERAGISTQSRLLGEVVAALQAAIMQAEADADRAGAKRRRGAAIATPGTVNDGPGAEEGGIAAGCAGEASAPKSQHHGATLETNRRRRWLRCGDWSRCAIGCLPCSLNPNGRLPPMMPTAQPLPPQPMSASDHEALGGCGAAVATTDAVVGARPPPAATPVLHSLPGQAQNMETGEQEYYMEPGDDEEGLGPSFVSEPHVAGGDIEGGDGAGDGDGIEDISTAVPASNSVFGTLLRKQACVGAPIRFLL